MSPSTGIRANAVVPGGVITNIEAEFRSEQAAAVVGPVLQATLPSVAAPEQVASAITFLLCDDAANINGPILRSRRRSAGDVMYQASSGTAQDADALLPLDSCPLCRLLCRQFGN